MCVCVRARACVCVCVCVCARARNTHTPARTPCTVYARSRVGERVPTLISLSRTGDVPPPTHLPVADDRHGAPIGDAIIAWPLAACRLAACPPTGLCHGSATHASTALCCAPPGGSRNCRRNRCGRAVAALQGSELRLTQLHMPACPEKHASLTNMIHEQPSEWNLMPSRVGGQDWEES